MKPEYLFVESLASYGSVPDRSILSSTLYNDDRGKVLLFRFAAGQELSAHTAPYPADIYFVSGEASLQLADDRFEVTAGAFAHMPAKMQHAIQAKTEVVMILTLFKA
jgi:quercetin dioxygenase-like cupin family protein